MIILRGLTITIDAIEIMDREVDPNGVDAGRHQQPSDPAGEYVPVNPGPPLGRVPPHAVPGQGRNPVPHSEKPGDTESPGAAAVEHPPTRAVNPPPEFALRRPVEEDTLEIPIFLRRARVG